MSVQKIKEKWGNFSGNINIYADLEATDIPKLAAEKVIHSIQFYKFHNPNKKTWETLDHFFKEYPNIGLSILWYDEQDWSFLKLIPSVKKLSLSSFLTTEFSSIADYVDLEQLMIGETKSAAVDVSFISDFNSLKVLSIDGMKKGLESIENLKELWSLNLRGVKLKTLDFTSELKDLRLLKLMFGSYEDLSSLSNLTNLEYLGISRTRKIPNYNFLKKLKQLEFLHFEGLSQMVKLPDFSGQQKLKKIQVENLSRLEDITSIKELTELKEFLLYFPENFKAALRQALLNQAFDLMMDMKGLESTNLFGWYKNGKILEMEKKGVKPWNYGLTKYRQNSEGGWTL